MNNSSFNAPTLPEVQEIEKRIKSLEQIDCDLATKATMTVVALGVKPSATLDIYKHEEDINSVKQKMSDAGLYFDDIEVMPFRNENLVASLAIAKSQQEATHLANLFKSDRTDESNIELGKSLGYPPTSTEAYIGKRERYERGLDPFVERRIPSNLQFMLSKDNWDQELQTAKDWLKAIKQTSPQLYQRILEVESSEYKGIPFIAD